MKKTIPILIILILGLFLLGCTQNSPDSNTPIITDQNILNDVGISPTTCVDIDCFIEASKDCSKAIWASEYGTSFEIKGIQDNKCIIYRSAPMDDECPFEIVDLTAMLERWKQQNYSTNDWQTCAQQWKALPAPN